MSNASIDILSRVVLAVSSSLHAQGKAAIISDQDLKALSALLAKIEKATRPDALAPVIDPARSVHILEEELISWKPSQIKSAIATMKSSTRPVVRKAAALMEKGLSKS